MEPNIKSHDVLLTEHITPRTGNVSRGDIIVARSPTNPVQFICKRVVALPGDHLLQHDGSLQHVFTRCFVLTIIEVWIRSDLCIFLFFFEVPKGHLWIEGDNTDNSTDSRNYGPIPMGLVRGRAVLRVWPLSEATVLLPPRGKDVN